MKKIIYLFSILLAVGCNQNNGDSFQLKPEEFLSILQNAEDYNLTMDAAIKLGKKQEVRWIDLRSEIDFQTDHIENAMHIPSPDILDPGYISLWENPSIAKILYGIDHAEANGPWMLLSQLGYTNIFVLADGFPAIGKEDNLASDLAKYDFNKVINEVKEQNRKEVEALKLKAVFRKPVVRVVPKKKKKVVEEEEGC